VTLNELRLPLLFSASALWPLRDQSYIVSGGQDALRMNVGDASSSKFRKNDALRAGKEHYE
jgi:hypothetical protein